MSTDPNTPRQADIEHQAASWLARRDRGLTAAEQDEYLQWLARDSRHGEWFAKHRQTVASLKLLAQWRPEHGIRPNPDLLAVAPRAAAVTAHRILRWWVPAGLAAAAALILLIWQPHIGSDAASVASAAPPAVVRRILDDGSTVDLNHGAEVAVNYSAGRRDIRLVRGEAHFTVTKDPERPFVVSVNNVEVCAVGTAFNVNFRTQAVEVLVTEGKVRVSQASLEHTLGNAAVPATVVVPALEAGHRTVIPLSGKVAAPKVDAVSAREIARVTAWQPRQLEFSDAPLAQVVAAFNASNRIKMVVDDPRLASLPVGASLRSDNIEGFVRMLEVSFHVTVDRRTDGVIVLRLAP